MSASRSSRKGGVKLDNDLRDFLFDVESSAKHILKSQYAKSMKDAAKAKADRVRKRAWEQTGTATAMPFGVEGDTTAPAAVTIRATQSQSRLPSTGSGLPPLHSTLSASASAMSLGDTRQSRSAAGRQSYSGTPDSLPHMQASHSRSSSKRGRASSANLLHSLRKSPLALVRSKAGKAAGPLQSGDLTRTVKVPSSSLQQSKRHKDPSEALAAEAAEEDRRISVGIRRTLQAFGLTGPGTQGGGDKGLGDVDAEHTVSNHHLSESAWTATDRPMGTEAGLRGVALEVAQSLEKQGAQNWSSNDIRDKYRDEEVREIAYARCVAGAEEAERLAREEGIIVPVVMVERHPIHKAFYEALQAYNSLAVKLSRKRNMQKVFSYDVRAVWLSGDLPNESPLPWRGVDYSGSATAQEAAGSMRPQDRLGVDDGQLTPRAVANRRDDHAIQVGYHQIQSVSLARSMQHAVVTDPDELTLGTGRESARSSAKVSRGAIPADFVHDISALGLSRGGHGVFRRGNWDWLAALREALREDRESETDVLDCKLLPPSSVMVSGPPGMIAHEVSVSIRFGAGREGIHSPGLRVCIEEHLSVQQLRHTAPDNVEPTVHSVIRLSIAALRDAFDTAFAHNRDDGDEEQSDTFEAELWLRRVEESFRDIQVTSEVIDAGLPDTTEIVAVATTAVAQCIASLLRPVLGHVPANMPERGSLARDSITVWQGDADEVCARQIMQTSHGGQESLVPTSRGVVVDGQRCSDFGWVSTGRLSHLQPSNHSCTQLLVEELDSAAAPFLGSKQNPAVSTQPLLQTRPAGPGNGTIGPVRVVNAFENSTALVGTPVYMFSLSVAVAKRLRYPPMDVSEGAQVAKQTRPVGPDTAHLPRQTRPVYCFSPTHQFAGDFPLNQPAAVIPRSSQAYATTGIGLRESSMRRAAGVAAGNNMDGCLGLEWQFQSWMNGVAAFRWAKSLQEQQAEMDGTAFGDAADADAQTPSNTLTNGGVSNSHDVGSDGRPHDSNLDNQAAAAEPTSDTESALLPVSLNEHGVPVRAEDLQVFTDATVPAHLAAALPSTTIAHLVCGHWSKWQQVPGLTAVGRWVLSAAFFVRDPGISSTNSVMATFCTSLDVACVVPPQFAEEWEGEAAAGRNVLRQQTMRKEARRFAALRAASKTASDEANQNAAELLVDETPAVTANMAMPDALQESEPMDSAFASVVYPSVLSTVESVLDSGVPNAVALLSWDVDSTPEWRSKWEEEDRKLMQQAGELLEDGDHFTPGQGTADERTGFRLTEVFRAFEPDTRWQGHAFGIAERSATGSTASVWPQRYTWHSDYEHRTGFTHDARYLLYIARNRGHRGPNLPNTYTLYLNFEKVVRLVSSSLALHHAHEEQRAKEAAERQAKEELAARVRAGKEDKARKAREQAALAKQWREKQIRAEARARGKGAGLPLSRADWRAKRLQAGGRVIARFLGWERWAVYSQDESPDVDGEASQVDDATPGFEEVWYYCPESDESAWDPPTGWPEDEGAAELGAEDASEAVLAAAATGNQSESADAAATGTEVPDEAHTKLAWLGDRMNRKQLLLDTDRSLAMIFARCIRRWAVRKAVDGRVVRQLKRGERPKAHRQSVLYDDDESSSDEEYRRFGDEVVERGPDGRPLVPVGMSTPGYDAGKKLPKISRAERRRQLSRRRQQAKRSRRRSSVIGAAEAAAQSARPKSRERDDDEQRARDEEALASWDSDESRYEDADIVHIISGLNPSGSGQFDLHEVFRFLDRDADGAISITDWSNVTGGDRITGNLTEKSMHRATPEDLFASRKFLAGLADDVRDAAARTLPVHIREIVAERLDSALAGQFGWHVRKQRQLVSGAFDDEGDSDGSEGVVVGKRIHQQAEREAALEIEDVEAEERDTELMHQLFTPTIRLLAFQYIKCTNAASMPPPDKYPMRISLQQFVSFVLGSGAHEGEGRDWFGFSTLFGYHMPVTSWSALGQLADATSTIGQWEMSVDPSTSDKFYSNTITGASVWEKPQDLLKQEAIARRLAVHSLDAELRAEEAAMREALRSLARHTVALEVKYKYLQTKDSDRSSDATRAPATLPAGAASSARGASTASHSELADVLGTSRSAESGPVTVDSLIQALGNNDQFLHMIAAKLGISAELLQKQQQQQQPAEESTRFSDSKSQRTEAAPAGPSDALVVGTRRSQESGEASGSLTAKSLVPSETAPPRRDAAVVGTNNFPGVAWRRLKPNKMSVPLRQRARESRTAKMQFGGGMGATNEATIVGLVNPSEVSSHEPPLTHYKAQPLLIETVAADSDRVQNAAAAVGMESEVGLAEASEKVQELNKQRAEEEKSNEMVRRAFLAVKNNKYGDLDDILFEGAVDVNIRDDAGNTLLVVAAQNGLKRIVKLLLRKGADMNLQNVNGNTALHYAFAYGFKELGDYLVDKGADDSISNADGLTCYEGIDKEAVDAL